MAQKIIIPEHNEDKVAGDGAAGSTGEDTYLECRGDELYAVYEKRQL